MPVPVPNRNSALPWYPWNYLALVLKVIDLAVRILGLWGPAGALGDVGPAEPPSTETASQSFDLLLSTCFHAMVSTRLKSQCVALSHLNIKKESDRK